MSTIEYENGVWQESLPGLAFGHFAPGGAGQVSLNIDTDRHAVEPTVPIKQLCEILALVDSLGCDPGGIDRFTPRAPVGRLA